MFGYNGLALVAIVLVVIVLDHAVGARRISPSVRVEQHQMKWMPGTGVAALGAAAAFGIHSLLPVVPWLTAALVLGVITGCIPPARRALDGVLRPGLALASRRLLRLGIVVLGLKLSLFDIARLGWVAVLLIIALVVVSFWVTWGIARLLRLPGDEPVLMAAGFSICGVSAIGAMSAARRSDAADSATPTALVTLYGTVAIVVLPALAVPLGLRRRSSGTGWVRACTMSDRWSPPHRPRARRRSRSPWS